MCKLDFRSQSGKGPVFHNSRLKCTNSGFETVHMGNHFEYILLYTPLAYTTLAHERVIYLYIFLLLFHYDDILTRTSKQLFEDRFGIAFRPQRKENI